jgi:hypothetical protein
MFRQTQQVSSSRWKTPGTSVLSITASPFRFCPLPELYKDFRKLSNTTTLNMATEVFAKTTKNFKHYKIRGSHSGGYEKFYLLGYNAV